VLFFEKNIDCFYAFRSEITVFLRKE
jgi:hypothetical protein